MKGRALVDNATSVTLAVIVHLVLVGVLVFTLDWNRATPTAGSEATPVQAVVVDESVVSSELERIRELETREREREAERIADLEREAERARQRRRQEEDRLAQVQDELSEQRRREETESEL
jgi:TolA protein